MEAVLMERRQATPRDHLYIFHCPAIAAAAQPGQFVEVKVSRHHVPFLRRPISIFDADGSQTFTLLVHTVGEGTALMEEWTPGQRVDVIGPLGHGFSWREEERTALLVAGGIGLAPMELLARKLLEAGKRVRLLFTPRRHDALLDALSLRDRVDILEADNREVLPQVLGQALDGVDMVYACGPEGMLETTARVCGEHGTRCQLSMERRMACGIGICLGCAVAIRQDGQLTYKKACKDGPVFWGEEVSFHELP